MTEFDKTKVTMRHVLHLNGGRAFNKTTFAVEYDGHEIGIAQKGREGDETIFNVKIDETVYDMKTEQEKAVLAIKDKFLQLKQAGKIA